MVTVVVKIHLQQCGTKGVFICDVFFEKFPSTISVLSLVICFNVILIETLPKFNGLCTMDTAALKWCWNWSANVLFVCWFSLGPASDFRTFYLPPNLVLRFSAIFPIDCWRLHVLIILSTAAIFEIGFSFSFSILNILIS